MIQINLEKIEKLTFSSLGLNILGIGSEDFEMEKEFKSGKTVLPMKENGKITELMGMGSSFTQTRMNMRASG